MSAPVAWSTTRIDSFTLPRSSKPSTLTFTDVADIDHVGGLADAALLPAR